jgi:hypothetical protein
VRGIGDRDGDGHDDVIIGTFRFSNDPQVNIVSGRTGETTTIRSPRGPLDDDFGYVVAGGLDLTGDDVPDFAVKNGTNSNIPKILVYSGATLEVVNTIEPGEDAALFGVTLALADVNGDGVLEVIIGDNYRINTFKPLSGQLIHWTARNPFRPEWYGNETALGDFNGDGITDFAGAVGQGGVMLVGGAPLLLSQRGIQRNHRLTRSADHLFVVHGAVPGRGVSLLASLTGNGCTFIGQLGICIDLDRHLYRLGRAITNANGFANVNVEIGPEVPLGPVWIQAVDSADPNRGPITSNVMIVEIVN